MAAQQEGGGRVRPRRRLLVALAVLIPAIPLAIGIAIALNGSGGTAAPASTTTAAATKTLAFTPVAATRSSGPPAVPHVTTDPAVPGGSGALVALVRHPTTLLTAPGGRSLAHLSTHTQFGSPETVLVVRQVPGWLGVVATEAGNGRIGWIAQGAASLTRDSWAIDVSLAARRLTVLDAGKVVARYTVAIGRPDAPTPSGRFAVTDRLVTNDPAGPYGCCILALSAQAPHAIQGWTGGNRIAIHSTPDTATIGDAVSHGCVHVTLAEGRWLLAHIPLGTPTLIRS
jgi:lipoprotein-anchoring transpeptidase ErfK/SrfK